MSENILRNNKIKHYMGNICRTGIGFRCSSLYCYAFYCRTCNNYRIITVFAMFVYYIFLAYAEDLNSKGLVNIALLFKFIKPGFKPLYIKLLLFVMFSIAVAVIYILLYIAAGLIGLDKIGHIAGDFYFMDIIMNIIAGYFVIVTWYFAFPYSLINSYVKNIRPLIRKDENNDANA